MRLRLSMLKLGIQLASVFLVLTTATVTLAQTTANSSKPPQRSLNSTEKIRPTPSELAAKVGSAVDWQTNFEAAQKLTVESGKPIFWYVPTVEGSFMDRKTEIDRYMRAGMFSWPRIIGLLNENFVPLAAAPTESQQQTWSLLPTKFVEPGFLVIDARGKTTLRCDRLTTQHPIWLESVLTAALRRANATHSRQRTLDRSPLASMWRSFSNVQYRQVLGMLEMAAAGGQFAVPPSAERELLRGMCQFRLGDHAAAKQTWAEAANDFPDDPLAWKAAAETEGLGPFVRGFEIHRQLAPSAYEKINLAKLTSTASADAYDADQLWRLGTQFLLGMQREDGAFVDCDYDFGGSDSLPNVHVAITAICGMALLESELRKVKVVNRQRRNAVELARNFVLDEANWNLNDSDELFWAHVFRVRFLAASARRGWNGERELQAAVDGLQSIQSKSGSWAHEYPNPLVTALSLVVLDEAKQAGATIDSSRIQMGIRSLQANRGRGGFFYQDIANTNPQARDHDQTVGSAGRLPLCEAALHRWGASDNAALAEAVRIAFEKQSYLLASLKYDDHTPPAGYGGFFFWFDLLGRTDAIAGLKDPSQRKQNLQRVRDLVLSLPELDGCFVDSHEIGRCYGTAMALLCLAKDYE